MSEPLRIGFVVEGPTDFVILESIAGHLLGEREYEPVAIRPLLSDAFAAVSGGGWTEVYFWCRQTAEQAGGTVRNDPLFDTFDLLVIQLDADVAEQNTAMTSGLLMLLVIYRAGNRVRLRQQQRICSAKWFSAGWVKWLFR